MYIRTVMSQLHPNHLEMFLCIHAISAIALLPLDVSIHDFDLPRIEAI